ncbi:transglutaminase [Anaerocolumna cellulosilytica]|uniref:Transglutaminase n=1 Tax=Anaerocolumna cellulosilytica TaxID=433286 RepID=A0A6S6R6F6_9FIRM|nr:transglutaminase domain-containing protein [Anaerocolumna cellulosilytica]MBB5193723.1 hypothetical protein [Anaerocolumna cellulosilytica]BCJ95060.1 transglutaminase [Anaerocolumna cellulosilytica]
MLMTKEERNRIEKDFEKIRQLARSKEDLFQILSDCKGEEEICMKFLYAYMPLSDLANYNGELFLRFVRHALGIRERLYWVKTLDTFVFLNYVLQYRINNEDIEFYSESFFHEIYPRIKEKSLEKAVLEVNYWCYEKATYQSSDIRTLSPLSVIRNTYGRCGEESVLAVAALRSVGIPARQCYVPRWAHCDDNHAWVEVYIEGEWKYLGACEPEDRLNKGWFVQPASRAMFIHSRIFSPFTMEKTIGSCNERLTELNITSRYAKTKEIKVQVFNRDGSYANGVEVRFEVVNFAAFYPLTSVTTDELGCAFLETGLGDLCIYAHNESEYGFCKIDVRLEDEVKITLGSFREEVRPFELTMKPPMGRVTENPPFTGQETVQSIRTGKAGIIRKAYEDTFFNQEKAKVYIEDYDNSYSQKQKEALAKNSIAKQARLKQILIHSRGNHEQITAFLEEEETRIYTGYKLALLESLSRKDLTDVKAEELKDFLLGAMPYKNNFKKDVFIPYVLCPRVSYEKLTAHRKKLMERFSKEEKEEFRSNPNKLFDYIRDKIGTFEELEYASLSASADNALTLAAGSNLTKKIAFVTILRTLGIPARMESLYLSVEYFKDNLWHSVNTEKEQEPNKKANLTLESNSEVTFLYYKNYSIARMEDGVFRDLELAGNPWEKQITYELRPGNYRVMTVNRESDGSVDALLYSLVLREGENKSLALLINEKRKAQNRIALKNRKLYMETEELTYLSKELKQKSLVIWLDLGREPTEHLLNELMDAKELIHKRKVEILAILNKQADRSNITFQKALSILPFVKTRIKTESDSLEDIYEAFGIADKQLPLAIVADENLSGIFGMAGYHVGIGELLLSHMKE